MNLLRKMNLPKRAVFVIVATVVFFGTYQTMAPLVEGQETYVGLRLNITVPDTERPAFQVPVNGMFALITAMAEKPVKPSENLPSYIKIVPQREGTSVRIKISALYGKLDKSDSIDVDQLKKLSQKPVGEFLVAPEDKIIVTELKSFGVRPLEIEVNSYEFQLTPRL